MATVPNLWEQYVIDALVKRRYEVYLPFKDKGIDLLAIRNWESGCPVRVQVKGSRTWQTSWPSHTEGCWHRLNREKVIKGRGALDLFIFVWAHFGRRGLPEMQYLMVPTDELIDRLSRYQKGRWDIYIWTGQRGSKRHAADLRPSPGERRTDLVQGDGATVDPQRDYTKYLNNWAIIDALARGAARQRKAA